MKNHQNHNLTHLLDYFQFLVSICFHCKWINDTGWIFLCWFPSRSRCLDVSAPSRVVLYTFFAWRSCPVGFSGVFSSNGEMSRSSIDRGFHHMFCRVVGIFACMYSKKKKKKKYHSLSLSLPHGVDQTVPTEDKV